MVIMNFTVISPTSF